MPLALLLSPDDQAVSAITAVLEEMSVTCERPLDGVSAAKQLNSNKFDLVLVDCENLPAAKLIFDVCRRGSAAHNPVPIAIVDGRAGLPTAFRLGAELILTKPVAKDQARSTIRSAVSRVKKEEPARTVQIEESISTEVAAPETSGYSTAAPLTSYQSTTEVAADSALAVGAGALASQTAAPTHQDDIPVIKAAPTVAAGMSPIAPPPPASAATRAHFPELKLDSTDQLSEDPVLAELEKAESEPASLPAAPMFSAYTEPAKKQKKLSGALIAVLAFLLMCAGLYAAWMTQPEFRAMASPQLDRVLALVGMTHTAPAPAPQAMPKPVAPPAPAASPDSNQAAQPGTDGSAAITGAPTSAVTTPGANAPASETTAAAPANTAANTASSHAVADGKALVANANGAKPAAGISAASDTNTVSDQSAVILSSKGAEKRLIHSVQPIYPAGLAATDGTVVLETVVDESGKVAQTKIVEGNPALAETAINAMKQWRYRPYLRDGKPVSFQTIVVIDFQRP